MKHAFFDRVVSFLLGFAFALAQMQSGPVVAPVAAASLSSEFGVVGAVPSYPSDGNKQILVDKIADLGMGWTRHEFHYADSMDWAPYDAAQSKIQAKGIKVLGLLAYPGSDKTHEQWKTFVRSAVERYGSGVAAWEVMNEADNYLSGADYVTYLKEAHEIIKSANPSATIVLAGITSRPETPNFWNAVGAAGGWSYFDVAGLHVYHSGNPEKVNFGGGDLLAEYDRAIAALNKNGGGKKIWITETGYKASDGAENQANWLARTLVMTRSVSMIEKIFIYRLADNDYGLADANLSNRPAYDRIKSVVSNLSGRGTGTRIYPAEKQTLDSLESTTGWLTKQSSNASLNLSTAGGKTGSGMKMAYNFTADSAYGVAEKSIAVNGTPEAFAAWFYGDGTKNVWKFRFKDAKGETFQTDLGSISADWQYKQFTIAKDDAMTSWDGDGKIDFPVSFNSFVIDRQGGDANGSGTVDELIAITGGADLFAFQFGDLVSYWKTSGTSSTELCGAKRDFSESPAYASGVSCSDTPKTTQTTSSAASSTKTTTKKAVSTPAPKIVVDKDKSTVRVDGENIIADGTASYRLVVVVKDTNSSVIKNIKPTFTTNAENGVTLSDPSLIGDEWIATAVAKTPGDKVVKIAASGTELKSVTLAFVAVPSPTPSPKPSPLTYQATTAAPLFPVGWAVAGVWSGLSVLSLGLYVLYKKKGWQILGSLLFKRKTI